MSSNHELEIIMTLRDEVSKKLQGIQGGFQKISNSSRELASNFRTTAKAVGSISTAMGMAGAAITAPLLLAFHNSAQYSLAVQHQMDRMKNATDQFQLSLANALLPVMEKFTNILGALLNAWNGLGPVVQQQIVQGAFMVGIFLSIGSVVGLITQKLLRAASGVLTLNAQFTGLIAANLPLILIIGSVAAILALMIKFKPVADTVMGTLQVLFLFFLNGLETIRLALSRLIAFWLGEWEKVFTFLSHIPGKVGQIFDGMAKGVKAVREEIDKLGDGAMVHLLLKN